MAELKMTPDKLQLAAAAYARGETYAHIAEQLGCSAACVSENLRRHGYRTRPRKPAATGPERRCPSCHATHNRKYPYCAPCTSDYFRAHKPSGKHHAHHDAHDCSTPPPPPPGFNLRDLNTGRPWL